MSWTRFIHPDDQERMKDYHYARRKDPAAAPTVYECRLVDAGGGIHNGFIHVGLIPGTGNSIASLVDVTALTQALDALKASDIKIREILDHLPDIIVVHREGTILYVNPAMSESMGWLPDEVLGQPILKFVSPKDHATVKNAVRLRLESGIDKPYIIDLLSRDGKPLTVSVRGTLVIISGSPAIMNILTDITTVKNAERALEESEKKYRMLVENINDIVYTADLSGTITSISPQIGRYGYSPAEIVSTNLAPFIPEEDLPVVIADFEKTVSTGKPTRTVFRVRDRTGTTHWFEDNGTAITDASGNVVGISGILRDITDRKKAEDALRHANRQLNLLGGITRHDILNKVSVILGYLEIAKESVKDPEMDGYLEKIESATRAIREQIEFMRLFRDIGTRAPEWVSLDSALPRKHIPGTIDFHAEAREIEILADPMVERVFYNLLDNSVRHGERVSAIRVSAQSSGDSLVIVWEDNGVGIAYGEKERIFDRGVGKNTGLGLFLAREILSLTGIALRETGEPGTGARFEITVPRDNFRIKGNYS